MSNPNPETDLELLDRYLDDALEPLEFEQLRRRLHAEPELAEALQDARTQRQSRQATWQSMEPGDNEVDQFIRTFAARTRRQDTRLRLTRVSRFFGAAAACIAFGFLAGWLGRGTPATTVAPSGRLHVASVTHDRMGDVPTFNVALTDDDGNVVAVQKFSRLEEAREFANDLVQWQLRRHEMGGEEILTVPVSAQF